MHYSNPLCSKRLFGIAEDSQPTKQQPFSYPIILSLVTEKNGCTYAGLNM